MNVLSSGIDTLALTELTDIKQAISGQNQYLDSHISHYAIADILQARSDFFDALLRQLWQQHQLQHPDLSLNAVGGYGRQTLHPFSDIDICILHHSALNPELENRLSAFITQLWDIGIAVGHGVLPMSQALALCRTDIAQATSMMEIRPLCGPQNHSHNILQALHSDAIYSSTEFFLAKRAEQQQRHEKASGSGYSLEPNLKTSPGGLRDIQTLQWVANKEFGNADSNTLRRFEFFTPDEYSELMECQNFLWRVRWALHMAVGRGENRLLIEYQSEVARRMGFGGQNNTAIEKMMRQLYRASSRVRELNQMLMAHLDRNILPTDTPGIITPLNDRFELEDGFIRARDNDVFIHRRQILVMFRLIAEHDNQVKGITPQTLRLVRQVRRRLLGDLQDFQDCRQEFVALFRHPDGLGKAFTLMHQYGLLAAYLPQWREIVGQMQFDLFHAYTVDEHTHRLLKQLYQFAKGLEDESLRNVGSLYRSLDNKDTLLFAALFHDLAKGRGGDHSKLGAVDAAHFARFHNLKTSQEKTISWLVENHLLMSITAQRMDIYNPEVISNFARQVKTETRLELLYCLTVADIQATNNNLWNDWRATLLKDLFQACRRALRNGLENMLELRSLIRERKADATALLAEQLPQLSSEDLKQLWKQMPLSFFANADAADITRYTQAIYHYHQDRQTTPLLLLDGEIYKGCSDLFVYTQDKPGLFVSLFNTLAGLKVSVKQAQISVTRYGYVVETLKILDYNDEPLQPASRRQQVVRRLQQVLAGKPVPARRKAKRHTAAFDSRPDVEFLHTRLPGRTLLNISALETPQIMSRIADAFKTMELNIHSARISTVGEKTDNVFSVSNREGTSLRDSERQTLTHLLKDSMGQGR